MAVPSPSSGSYLTAGGGIWLDNDDIRRIPHKSRGSYVLLVHLDEGQIINAGKLPGIYFRRGFYAYAGSAMNGLKARLARHFREDKKRHWHIDYLMAQARIIGVGICETGDRSECAIARALGARFESVSDFGSSDCYCPSHLFFDSNEQRLRNGIMSVISFLPPIRQ